MRLWFLPIALVVWLAGCQPDIGDSCSTNVECSATGDRTCDTSQPGGYCTIFGCDPKTCPTDESICVSFNNALSTVPGCQNLNRSSPYERTFCMATCNDSGDCRGGYDCVDLAHPNPWGAVVIQERPPTSRVCIARLRGSEVPSDRSNEVCRPTSSTEWPGWEGGAGAGNAGAGNAGAGGEGG